MKKILLLAGGSSYEHDVSINSAKFILKIMDPSMPFEWYPLFLDKKDRPLKLDFQYFDSKALNNIYIEDIKWPFCFNQLERLNIDAIFPVFHGSFGENGQIQGYFDILKIPYVGNSMVASALAMDKILCKLLAKSLEIPVVDFLCIQAEEWIPDLQAVHIRNIESEIGYPLFVKPANLGSSIGISRVDNLEALKNAINLAFTYSYKILIEKALQVRELEIAVLESEQLELSQIAEILYTDAYYDYFTKYSKPLNAKIPADLNKDHLELIQRYSKLLFKMMESKGFARFDFFLDKNTHQLYLNEINTMPGLTENSVFFKLWKNLGLSAQEIIVKMIFSAFKKKS